MGKKGAKRHQKRLAAPITYQLSRKSNVFTFHARNGAHAAHEGIPLGIVLRDMWGFVQNRKELKFILNNKEVLVDGKPINDSRYIVGPMDVITIKATNQHFRVLPWTGRRRLNILEIDEEHAHWKLFKILDKTTVRGGDIQLNCTAGRNILLRVNKEGNYKSKFEDPATFVTKGTIKFDLRTNEILDYYPLEEGVPALITAGVNTGIWGTVQHYEKRIGKNKSICILQTPDDKQVITALENVFVIGKDKPELQQYQELHATNVTEEQGETNESADASA